MKFLSGLEELQIGGRPEGGALVFDGRMPWGTNLRPEGFHVAGVASGEDGRVLCVSFASDDPGLSRKGRRELPRLLIARGHDIGEVDGIIGSASREAIRAEQARLGLPVDGRAGQKLLRALSVPAPGL